MNRTGNGASTINRMKLPGDEGASHIHEGKHAA